MSVGKKKIGTERIRLTVGEARGTPLQDKTKPLSEYLPKDDKEVILFFKDLGL